jgi:uncharacterized membrane protein
MFKSISRELIRMTETAQPAKTFSTAEMGMIAHLYRGEVYRSTIWRSRLDNTTNWAVVTTGIALSLSYHSTNASPLPLILVGLLLVFFLLLESRRYRYFNVWRARCRLMETEMISPLLLGKGVALDGKWNTLLSDDYRRPHFHISFLRAVGRRLRKNYSYILAVQAVAYIGKLLIHPGPLNSFSEFFQRAAIGAIPGEVVIFVGVLFHCCWLMLAFVTFMIERRYRRPGALISIA